MRIPLHKRLALELLDLAASFGVQDSRGTILTFRTTHEDLADSVGVSRQMITQTLAHFERHGALIRDGRRLILNSVKLRKLLEDGGNKEGSG
jgi:CRP/FNR family cyclic AMP-dependent transcriptional regulator